MSQPKLLLAGLFASTLCIFCGTTNAMDDAALGDILDQRLLGDQSGACFAAAFIDGEQLSRAWRCADPADLDRISPDMAFEIGSISKTMTGILLAELIAKGEASLDDPLADYLPQGTKVPDYEGQPIRLRHVVTHTSGLPRLPSRLEISNPNDPYADFEADALLASLDDVTLTQAPGEHFEYSNFATMLLSLALSRQAQMSFERLLDERLLSPLGMTNSYIANRPDGLPLATGHLPDGQETSPWTFADELAGVGGVHSTLDDMVRYAQAQLGVVDSPIAEAIKLAQQTVETSAEQAMAMQWLLLPIGNRLIHAHDGGTGGFSSMLAFDLENRRAAVVLSDTTLAATGGVNDVAGHLLDDSIPLSTPRQAVERPEIAPSLSAEALREYAGTYPLMPGFDLAVREHEGTLHAQATGQGEFPLEAVAEDLFEAADFGIEIHFSRDDSGEVTALQLHQGGHILSGERQ